MSPAIEAIALVLIVGAWVLAFMGFLKLLDFIFGTGELRSCRECGCDEFHACPGGCWWVEPDLCSACADPAGLPVRELA